MVGEGEGRNNITSKENWKVVGIALIFQCVNCLKVRWSL